MNTVTNLDVNDYLDLYLHARHIGDILWQDEIIEKLQNFPNENSLNNQFSESDTPWDKYKLINEEILTLYQQLRNQSTNDELQEKILNLKQQRISLGRLMGLAKGNSF
jgi:hypothetical protein